MVEILETDAEIQKKELEKFAASWPTGKPHVSFSELSDWIECSWRHKLKHIDKLGTFDYSPYLDFGTGCHASIEDYIRTRVMDKNLAFKIIRDAWEKHGQEWSEDPRFKKDKEMRDVEGWIIKADRILSNIPDFLDKEFPGWECHEAEELLYESIEGQQLRFKGYIDAIIKVPTKKAGKFIYWIIDWKTCSWGWSRWKKQDFNVHLQLILYKSFWSKKHAIPMKDIRCGFGLLKRDKIKSGEQVSVLPVSVGSVTETKGLKVIQNHTRSVSRGMFLKNRESCKYCDFENTEHCTPNL